MKPLRNLTTCDGCVWKDPHQARCNALPASWTGAKGWERAPADGGCMFWIGRHPDAQHEDELCTLLRRASVSAEATAERIDERRARAASAQAGAALAELREQNATLTMQNESLRRAMHTSTDQILDLRRSIRSLKADLRKTLKTSKR